MSAPIDCGLRPGRDTFEDVDDEVFVDDQDEGVELRDKTTLQPRVRRVSDVIDSIGDMSPIQHTILDAMEALEARRQSDPAGLLTRANVGPARRSDSFTGNGSAGRPQSVLVDQGYGSSSTMSPHYLVYSHPPVPVAAMEKKPANDTIDAQPYNVPPT